MANEKFRSGQELDDEDSLASRAVGIRQGQIIQTHNAIQDALRRMEEAAPEPAAAAEAVTPELPPDPAAGKGAFSGFDVIRQGEIADAIAAREAVEGPDPRAAKRRPGFAAIGEGVAPEDEAGGGAVAAEVAGTAAGGAAAAGGAGLVAAGGLGAVAAFAAQQAVGALTPDPQAITAPGGGRTVELEQQDDLRALLEIQEKVAKVGLPAFEGVKTTAAGSKL